MSVKTHVKNVKFFKKKYDKLNDPLGTTSHWYLHTQEIKLNTVYS